ncbi:Leucine-rich repeat-containing protein 75B [Manis javanica]|nr:Leucine-rich repeat-containing protein 75B [Manis javanica]
MGLLLKSLARSPPRQISDSTSALEEGRQAAMQPGRATAHITQSPKRQLTPNEYTQPASVHHTTGQDPGLEGTLLTDILYRNMAFLNLVDPISHDQLVNLARDLQCPKTAARVQPAPEEDSELPQEQPPEDSAGGGAHEPLGNPAESTGPAAHNTLPEQPGSWAGGAGPELQRAD